MPSDDIIDGVAYLDSRFNLDAPMGDLAFEGEVIDADRVREGELARQKRGRTTINAGALHGDRLVAWTQLSTSRIPSAHAWQSITLVDPEHRGHRLGLLVKLANLAQLRAVAPGVERISTFNADNNPHMLAINRQMGFRAVESAAHYQWTA
jgi:GNAT superfamily N-acetyltransferase